MDPATPGGGFSKIPGRTEATPPPLKPPPVGTEKPRMGEDFQPSAARRTRVGLGLRLLLLVSGVASLSTALALGLQDRVLASDLRRAADGRAERAAAAVELLVESHLASLTERYRAISRTPALRATLEVDDAPTLRFYADSLRTREGAAAIAFFDHAGEVSARVGEAALLEGAATERLPDLVRVGADAFAVVSIPLETRGQPIGRLVAAEVVDSTLLESWSELSGAEVVFEDEAPSAGDSISRTVRDLDGLALAVVISLRDEQQALLNSRRNLLMAGGVALALAFGVSLAIARSITRPIRAIQTAAGNIGEGAFDTRIGTRRSDEIGDVARAVDDMGERLADYRSQVEAQTRQLESSIVELEESQIQLANAQRLAQMGSWELDPASGEMYGSAEFRALLGLPEDRKPIDPEWLLAAIHEADRDEIREAALACLDGAATLRVDCRFARPGLPERVMHVQARVESDGRRPGQRLEGTIQDVTERRRAEEQIRYLNHHDPLTGLGNRRLFIERVEIQIQQARRSRARVGVIHLDVDRFGRINDTFGPSLGDQLLKDVADRLVATLDEAAPMGRQGAESVICRLGADEFALCLPDDQGPGLSIVARRLADAMARPFHVAGHEVPVERLDTRGYRVERIPQRVMGKQEPCC